MGNGQDRAEDQARVAVLHESCIKGVQVVRCDQGVHYLMRELVFTDQKQLFDNLRRCSNRMNLGGGLLPLRRIIRLESKSLCAEHFKLQLLYEFSTHLLAEQIGKRTSQGKAYCEVELVSLMLSVVEALANLARLNIAHGKVSASTIVLDENGAPKLLDPELAACCHQFTPPIQVPQALRAQVVQYEDVFKGDVFRIGYVVLQAALLEPLKWNIEGYFPTLNVDFNCRKLQDKYSPELVSLISSCLRDEPIYRPSLQELTDKLQKMKQNLSKSKLQSASSTAYLPDLFREKHSQILIKDLPYQYFQNTDRPLDHCAPTLASNLQLAPPVVLDNPIIIQKSSVQPLKMLKVLTPAPMTAILRQTSQLQRQNNLQKQQSTRVLPHVLHKQQSVSMLPFVQKQCSFLPATQNAKLLPHVLQQQSKIMPSQASGLPVPIKNSIAQSTVTSMLPALSPKQTMPPLPPRQQFGNSTIKGQAKPFQSYIPTSQQNLMQTVAHLSLQPYNSQQPAKSFGLKYSQVPSHRPFAPYVQEIQPHKVQPQTIPPNSTNNAFVQTKRQSVASPNFYQKLYTNSQQTLTQRLVSLRHNFLNASQIQKPDSSHSFSLQSQRAILTRFMPQTRQPLMELSAHNANHADYKFGERKKSVPVTALPRAVPVSVSYLEINSQEYLSPQFSMLQPSQESNAPTAKKLTLVNVMQSTFTGKKKSEWSESSNKENLVLPPKPADQLKEVLFNSEPDEQMSEELCIRARQATNKLSFGTICQEVAQSTLIKDLPSRRQGGDGIPSEITDQPFADQFACQGVGDSRDCEFVIEEDGQGGRYEGWKVGGQRHGQGKYFYEDGAYYSGQWQADQIQGVGVLYYPNGKPAYDGTWIADCFHGQGILYNELVDKSHQPFNYSDFNEIGSQWQRFEGEFVEDLKHGRGRLFLSNGEVFEGWFEEDEIQGEGTFFRLNGTVVQGAWQQNILQQEWPWS